MSQSTKMRARLPLWALCTSAAGANEKPTSLSAFSATPRVRSFRRRATGLLFTTKVTSWSRPIPAGYGPRNPTWTLISPIAAGRLSTLGTSPRSIAFAIRGSRSRVPDATSWTARP
jgi:hypothetical protein